MADLASTALPAWPTESFRLRDVAPGPAGVVRLVGSARVGDVAGALGALTPDQLADGVAAAELPLAPAVVAHVSRNGPAQARRMLARRLVQEPEHVPARPLDLDAYRRTLTVAAATDYRDGIARVRALALEALCAGAITAEQLVEHTHPAALTLALAVCTPAEYQHAWIRRATGDIRVLLVRLLTQELGDDSERWAATITLSGSFAGTIAELVHSDEAPAGFRRFFDATRTDYAPQNVLLALAPRTVATRYAASLPATQKGTTTTAPNAFRPRRADHPWEWILTSAPLSRPLVDHVLAQGTERQRRWLLANELCPDFALEREQSTAGPNRGEILLRKVTPPHIRAQVFRTFAAEPREARLWARGLAGERRDQLVDLAWALTDAPNLLRHVVAAVLDRADPATLTCLYGALAEAAGPEPVWALELQRAGTLDDALPQVHASMAACTAEPLVEAARSTPRRHWIDALDDDLFGCQVLRSEAELERTGHFPLEALVAAHLDGRPERWRAVARRLAAAGPDAESPIETLIAEAASHPAAPAFTT